MEISRHYFGWRISQRNQRRSISTYNILKSFKKNKKSCFIKLNIAYIGFTGIPDNIDAALVWSGNGKIYFYKGSKFWRFDPAQRPPVKSTYPKPLSNWEGVPNNIDAALHYTNGYTYFFKDGAYYRFNDRTFSVSYIR